MALLVSGVYAVGAAPVLPTKQFLFSDAATYPACDERLQDLNKLFNERSICKTKSGLAMRNVSTEGNLENAPAMIVGDKATLPNLMTPPSCHSCVALQLLRGGKGMGGACPDEVGEAHEPAVLYRVSSYDACNPYESMHAHLNLFVAMERLQLKAKDIQVVFKDNVTRSDSCSHELDFWDRVNPNKPPLYMSAMTETGKEAKEMRQRLSQPFRGTVIDAAPSGESLLCAKSSKGNPNPSPNPCPNPSPSPSPRPRPNRNPNPNPNQGMGGGTTRA